MFKAIPYNTTIHDHVIFRGKPYQYTVRNIGPMKGSDGEDMYHLSCRGAAFTQDFLLEDLDGGIAAISDFLEDMEKEKVHTVMSRFAFRLLQSEKEQIEENAKKYGFANSSQYLRTVAINPFALRK